MLFALPAPANDLRVMSCLQEERGQRRLAFLLKQAEVFQHFAPDAAESDKGKKYGPAPHPCTLSTQSHRDKYVTAVQGLLLFAGIHIMHGLHCCAMLK